jgi:N-formylglutamate amidohydrolase
LSELEQRLDRAHRPYHAAIASQLSGLHDRFGCALLIDCHSMPPPAPGVAEIVFGDRFGRTCDDWLSREALAIARAEGFGAGINDPFAGGHIIERHGRPAGGTHALQLEIDRALYLDRVLAAPGPGCDRVARLIETLVVELGSALLGGRIATAAE